MSSNKKDEKQGPCRDYERGVCNRGNRCRFYHPEGVIQPDKKLPICKDYQNKGCDRLKCKFLHITQDEEANYNMNGVLPPHGDKLNQARPIMVRGAYGGKGSGQYQVSAGPDVCKDFLNNVCNRHKCKFRHITERENELEQQLLAENYIGGMSNTGMFGKRRRDNYGGGMGGAYDGETEMLRQKITDLQKQVLDLRQMNDALYDQNTRYRNQLHSLKPHLAPVEPVSVDPYLSKIPAASTVGYTQF